MSHTNQNLTFSHGNNFIHMNPTIEMYSFIIISHALCQDHNLSSLHDHAL